MTFVYKIRAHGFKQNDAVKLLEDYPTEDGHWTKGHVFIVNRPPTDTHVELWDKGDTERKILVDVNKIEKI